MTWGFCQTCYKKDECYEQYLEYRIDAKKDATIEDPVLEADIASFSDFVHGGITQQECQYYNLALLIAFTSYFLL